MSDSVADHQTDIKIFEQEYREFYKNHIEVNEDVLKKAHQQAQSVLVSKWVYVIILSNTIHISLAVS